MKRALTVLTVLTMTAAALVGTAALAYDGTNCKAPGNCWEPKPGYPAKVAGSQYDPQHDPAELSKQSQSIAEMEKRNALRVKHFKATGKFEFDVSKIPASN